MAKKVVEKKDIHSIHSHLALAIGELLLESRLKKNLLQYELAKTLDMTGQFLGRIEKGHVMLPEEWLIFCIDYFQWETTKVFRLFKEAAGKEALELCIRAKGVGRKK